MMDKKRDTIKKITERTTLVYVMVMLLVFPLIYHNNYIDIVQTKKYTFLIATAVYVLVCSVCAVIMHKREDWKFDSVDMFAGILGIGLILSTLFAEDKFDAFWGGLGRYFGAIVLFAAIAVYFFVSRYFVISQMVLWAFLLGSGCVFILDILNTFQVDILHMTDNLDSAQHYFFIGTMGNIDLEAEYAALMLPIGMILFYYAKESFSEWMYGIYVWLGFAAMLCCRCDTAVVCVAVAFLLMYWFGFESVEKIQKVQQLFLLWILASGCIGILRYAMCERVFEFDHLGKMTVMAEVIALEMILWGILESCLYFSRKSGRKNLKQVRNVLGVSFGVCAIVAGAATIFINCNVHLPIEGTIFEHLRITDEFGNYRGYIWKRSAWAYRDTSVFRKIFGYGMNQFPTFIRAYEDEMIRLYQIPFGDAHNEYLQILATIGIVGAVGFFGMFAASLWKCVRKMKNEYNMATMMGVVVLVIYFVQGVTNNPQVFTTPLYFVFMGIIMKKS